jgi:hypothetical protein
VPRTRKQPSIRLSLVVFASAALGASVFLGTALGGGSAAKSNYALHFGDSATWSNADLVCQIVQDQQGAQPIVCGRASAGKGSGVIFTRGTIVVYNSAGKTVYHQKRKS